MRFPWRPQHPTLVSGPVEEVSPTSGLGFYGDDLAALRPELRVAEGDAVAAGQMLVFDRKRPWLSTVSPVCGVVTAIERGPRRGLSLLQIHAEGEAAKQFDTAKAVSRDGLSGLMVEAGLWTAIRTRPFGHVPDPISKPDALFVTAIETAPGAPDASTVIAQFSGWFEKGLAALPVLSEGMTWLCHAPQLSPPAIAGVTARAFSGSRNAGLAGTHIHRLHPVAHGGSVWQIGWQEVIALGCLLETGHVWQRRVVALSGSGTRRPGLLLVPPGIRLHDLAAGRLHEGKLRLLDGNRDDGTPSPFLRRRSRQVTALRHHHETGGRNRLRELARAATPPFIPNAWDEALSPPGILPVPLLRALASGDAQTARQLGVLGLLEEDIAMLNTRLGHRGLDYRALLRQTLDELEAAA